MNIWPLLAPFSLVVRPLRRSLPRAYAPAAALGLGLVGYALVTSPGRAAEAASVTARLSLAGEWRFALDRADTGSTDRWFTRSLPEHLRLPGSLQEQGFGDPPSLATQWMGDLNDRRFFTEPRYAPYRDPANFKFPYWLTPTRTYTGVAWYQRDIQIPEDWKDHRVVLHLERPHWETTVWLDDRPLGSQNSLAVPHRHVLPPDLAPGAHRLTVRVDNRYVVPIGVNSHSISDHTQGNWNGLAGALELQATPPSWIDEVYVDSLPESRSARVRVTVNTIAGGPVHANLIASLRPAGIPRDPPLATRSVGIVANATAAPPKYTIDLPLGEAFVPWDEFRPRLYDLEVTLHPADQPAHTRRLRVGFRDVKTEGHQILINGRRVFLRGTLECAIFPLTGYPPTDVPHWKHLMTVARAHGLNHLRFHSWTPPAAAFEAADELGMYLYVECPTWANGGTSVGDGRPVDAWIQAEGDRLLREFGNHPSFILMSYGNEPGGAHQKRWLGDLVRHWQKLDARRLYSSAAGWPMIPENDVHITPDARAHPVHATNGETAGDYRAFLAKQSVPVVSHEIGQYCVFPNLDERPKYRGWLQARNFDIVADFLRQGGMLDQAPAFLRASGRLQVAFYKDEIEACLRTQGWGGFELLDLHDFPGQGTALVGILDPFWSGKGYVAPAEFRRFCDETVPLARLPKRVWTRDESLRVPVEIAHFGAVALAQTRVEWRVRTAAGGVAAHGAFHVDTLPTGGVTPLGEVSVPLNAFAKPSALALEVSLPGTRFVNDWNFWVYPTNAVPSPAPRVRLATRFDDTTARWLAEGARVVLLAPPAAVAGNAVGRFDPVFWNRNWFPTQPQHTLGLLVDRSHPALAGFPTANHADWQWQDLQNHSKPMLLDALPPTFRPTVQVIDDWNTCRKLGLLFEARVGRGRLLVCSIDLDSDLPARPAARALRRSLLDYAASRRFAPSTALTADQLHPLFVAAPPLAQP